MLKPPSPPHTSPFLSSSLPFLSSEVYINKNYKEIKIFTYKKYCTGEHCGSWASCFVEWTPLNSFPSFQHLCGWVDCFSIKVWFDTDKHWFLVLNGVMGYKFVSFDFVYSVPAAIAGVVYIYARNKYFNGYIVSVKDR